MLNENLLPQSRSHFLVARSSIGPAALAAALLLCAIISFLAVANDWPRWRGTDFNGISNETGWSTSWPQEGPRQLWKANVGTGFSSIAVSNGRAYTLGNINDTETIYCFDANTGNVLWKYSYACSTDPNLYEGGPNATPTVAGETVYTFSRKGHVFALDAGSGKVIWSKNIHGELGPKIPSWGFSGSPLVDGKLLIINAGPAGTALDKATGKVVWSSGKESAGYSSPLPFTNGPTRAALLFSTKALSAVDPENGQLLWEHPWKTPWGVNAADPVIVDDKMFISSGYNQGCALLRVAGDKLSVLWQNKNLRNHFNSSVAVGDSVYGFDESSELKCLDLKTGDVKWSEKSLGKGSLIAADGKLLILGEKGQLVAANPSSESFKPLACAQVLGGKCWTSPVLANGKVYCRNAKGDLACVDVSGRSN